MDTKRRKNANTQLIDKKPNVEIIGNLFDKHNNEIATGTKDILKVHNGKMILGAAKSGSLAMVFNCSDKETAYIREYVKQNLP